MPDQPKEEKKGFLDYIGLGSVKKAGKDMKSVPNKVDKAVDDAMADDPKKGKDAGELGKKWDDNFKF
jgi:hypothetical protein